MNVARSVAYLLQHAGPVIRWRLRREILKDLTASEEDALLQEVLQMPLMQQLATYRKPSGYIGMGMHSAGLGIVSPLQDGESAARLLANYAIPAEHPLVKDFVAVLEDEDALRQEFLCPPAEAARFKNRNRALGCGGGLNVLVWTLLAMLGEETPAVSAFAATSLAAFRRVLKAQCLADMTDAPPRSGSRYAYPVVEEDGLFPCQYHLETLAHTRSWRTPDAIADLAAAVDRINTIMKPDDGIHVRIGSRLYVPYWAYCRTIKPFEQTDEPHTALRKTLTCLAMATGDRTQVVQRSVANVIAGMQEDGVLRIPFTSAYRKKQFRDGLSVPTAYSEIGLEAGHRQDERLWCELTFWGVQLLWLTGQAEGL